jgi:CRISPR/Cas system CMR-associated protein Cmr5 small subunit
MRTLEQMNSEAAWSKVSNRVVPQNGKRIIDDKYVSCARSFPALIHHAGLSQALAFLRANEPITYCEDLVETLKAGSVSITNIGVLLTKAQTDPIPDYMQLTRDCMRAARWIKTAVDALEEK